MAFFSPHSTPQRKSVFLSPKMTLIVKIQLDYCFPFVIESTEQYE